MTARRLASLAGALVVATIAALASYSHMRGLSLRYGQPEWIANLLPVSVDGMMLVATVALGDGRRHRWSAWLAFWIGVVASVLANVLAAQPSVIARCISAWPAVAFLLVVEIITRGACASLAVAMRTTEAADGEQAAAPTDGGVSSDASAVVQMPARPPVPAAEVPPTTTARPQPSAELAAQPAQSQVPAEVPPPAARARTAVAYPAAEVHRQPPVPAVTVQRPHPVDVEQTSPLARGDAAADPHVDGIAAPHVTASTVSPQPTGGVPPVRVVAPPDATAAVVPAQVQPPRREGSGPRTRRNPSAAAVNGAGRAEPPPRDVATGGRRPAATTRRLARQILDAEPDLSRTEVAARLGVSTRRLREVLAASA